MENFNDSFQQERTVKKPVREKSIYSLNLDGPRIAILCLVIAAIVAVTFLIGMKFSEDESIQLPQTADVSAGSEFQETNSLNALPGETSPEAALMNNTTPETAVQTVKDPLFSGTASNSAADSQKIDESALTAKTTETPVLSSKPRTASKTKSSKAVASSKKISADKNSKVKPAFASIGKKNSGTHSFTKTPVRSGFAVQVASFDSYSKAKAEVSKLKSMQFDAFVDKTSVNGQLFFRVKIGPVADKSEATDILERIQENSRYSESYIIKEM